MGWTMSVLVCCSPWSPWLPRKERANWEPVNLQVTLTEKSNAAPGQLWVVIKSLSLSQCLIFFCGFTTRPDIAHANSFFKLLKKINSFCIIMILSKSSSGYTLQPIKAPLVEIELSIWSISLVYLLCQTAQRINFTMRKRRNTGLCTL